MSSLRKAGLLAAALTLAADQASKLFLLVVIDLPARGMITLSPVMDLVTAWNYGISYGMLQQNTALGRYALLTFQIAATLFLGLWMWRADRRWTALGLGLIIGGAIGNIIDRAVYGAVFDFVHMHLGDFSWYIFNIADAAIVAGVAALLYDTLQSRPAGAKEMP